MSQPPLYREPAFIPAPVWDHVRTNYPDLAGCDPFAVQARRFTFHHLYYGWRNDHDSDSIVVSHKGLKLFFGEPRLNVGRWLERYTQLWPGEVIPCSREHGIARSLRLEPDPELAEIRMDCARRPREFDRIRLSTLEPIRPKPAIQEERALQRQELERYMADLPAVPQADLCRFLVGQSERPFRTQADRTRDAVLRQIVEMDNGPRQLQALSIYERAAVHPQPSYRITDSTQRLSADHSVCYYPREVFSTAFEGWMSLDATSMQLAILAARRPELCADLYEFLRDYCSQYRRYEAGRADKPEGVWGKMLRDIGIPADQHARHKPALKEGTYQLCYCGKRFIDTWATGQAPKPPLYKAPEMTHSGLGWDLAKRLRAHPFIEGAYQVREALLNEIHRRGFGYDFSGAPIHGSPSASPEKAGRSILAQENQSREQHYMRALLPVLQRYDVSVVWKHDGLVAHAHDAKRLPTIKRALQDAFEDTVQPEAVPTLLGGGIL